MLQRYSLRAPDTNGIYEYFEIFCLLIVLLFVTIAKSPNMWLFIIIYGTRKEAYILDNDKVALRNVSANTSLQTCIMQIFRRNGPFSGITPAERIAVTEGLKKVRKLICFLPLYDLFQRTQVASFS